MMSQDARKPVDEALRHSFIASVDETLTKMGARFKRSILHHVNRRTSLTLSDAADKPDEFMAPLVEILGAGSVRVLEEHIARLFYDKVGVPFSPKQGHTLQQYLSEAKEFLKNRPPASKGGSSP